MSADLASSTSAVGTILLLLLLLLLLSLLKATMFVRSSPWSFVGLSPPRSLARCWMVAVVPRSFVIIIEARSSAESNAVPWRREGGGGGVVVGEKACAISMQLLLLFDVIITAMRMMTMAIIIGLFGQVNNINIDIEGSGYSLLGSGWHE